MAFTLHMKSTAHGSAPCCKVSWLYSPTGYNFLAESVPRFSFLSCSCCVFWTVFWNCVSSPLRVLLPYVKLCSRSILPLLHEWVAPLCQKVPFFKWFDRCYYRGSFLFRSYFVLIFKTGPQQWYTFPSFPFSCQVLKVTVSHSIDFHFTFFHFHYFPFLYFFQKNKTK